MRTRGVFASLALLAGFAAITSLALAARFRRDAYPVFSSLRSDPVGTSLFFDGLARTGPKVERDYDGDRNGISPASTTRFFIASGDLPPETAEALYSFILAGGRLIWLEPAPPPPIPLAVALARKQARPPLWQPPDLWRWLGLEQHPYAAARAMTAEPAASPASPKAVASEAWPLDPRGLLSAPLPISSDGYLKPLEAGWIPVYVHAGHAVMLTRRLGRGSVVVASDATFLTNRQVRVAANAPLLLWLVGGRQRVVVDETRHGLVNRRGMAWLFARYHLRLGLLALFCLFALAVWRWAPAWPPPSGVVGAGALEVESARQGYIRLLRRAIPPRTLLAFCLREAGREEAAPPAASPEEIVAAFNSLTHV